MADVANSISSSPQGRSNSYVTSPCSSSNALVSPNIVEAIDRIFPKSPSQLLPESICSRRTSLGGLPQSQSSVISSQPCTVSMDHFPADTTTTATAVFTGLTSSSGTKSPLMSTTPTSQMDLPSLPAQIKVNQVPSLKNGTIDLNCKKSDLSNAFVALNKISKADLEMMNNLSMSPKNGKSGRGSLPENECGDLSRQDGSDSDDMCRPFVQLQKEKKKKKRKHMWSSNQRLDLSAGKTSDSSDTPPVIPRISKLTIVRPATAPGQSNEDDYCLLNSQKSAVENGHHSDLNGPNVNPPSNKKGETLLDSLSGCSLSESSSVDTNIVDSKDSGYVNDRKWTSLQSLPKATRLKYHVRKDVRRIKSTFLPCFVVLRSMSYLDLRQGFYKGSSTVGDFSIKERVKYLSTLCAQSKFECKFRKKSFDDVLSYKNFMDNSQCSNSEDEFRIPHGRSLRKRRQDICYVEPSEDDLPEDLSISSRKKRSGQGKKESSPKGDSVDENQSPKDISPKRNVTTPTSPVCREPPEKKIKKKSTFSPSNADIVLVPETTSSKERNQSSVQLEPNQNTVVNSFSVKEGSGKKNDATIHTRKAASGPNLVYVYPNKKVVRGHSRSNVSESVVTLSDNAGKGPGATKDTVSKEFNPALSMTPGSASKSNRPSEVVSRTLVTPQIMTTTPNSTSAIPFPLGFTGTPLAAQNPPNLATNANLSNLTVRNNTLPSNLCMVKIDGKDYLLSMPASNNIGNPVSTQLTAANTTAIPFPQPNLMSAPGQRFMFYQSSPGVMPSLRPAGLAQGIVTTKGMNPPMFTIPQLPTAVCVPGRVSSNAIQLLPSSVPAPCLLSTQLLPSTFVSTSSVPTVAMSSTQSRLSNPISSTARSLSTTQTSISVPKPTSSKTSTVSSGVISSSLQASGVSSAVSTSLPVRQVRSLVGPLIAPGSTTVIRHPGQSTTTTSSPVQLVAPNASVSGARCFRIIVPGCSAAGSTARIATLGTSALSSPLTRLSASSALLPQRKQSADKEMSPEKRAAKRRRLEKKYPLPPGVVIKTEPLDNPQTSLTIQAGSVRSLLTPQNIQLITASSRTGVSGVQRFRIIAPSATGGLVGSRPVRLGSNVIIRAPIVSSYSSRPAVTSATSSIQMITSSSVLTSSSSSTLVTASTSSVSSASLDTAVTTTTTSSLSTSVSTASRGTISLLSPGSLLLSSTTSSAYPVPTSSVLVSSISSSSVVTTSTSSCTALTSAHISTLSPAQPISASSPAEPVSVSSASSVESSESSTPALENGSGDDQPAISEASNTPQAGSRPASSCAGSVADISTMRQSVEKLEKLISGQEALGLKGARLDKLKELLSQKMSALSELEQTQTENVPLTETNGRDEGGVVDMGATADDPVVID